MLSQIMNYFPRQLTPRLIQTAALKETERSWDRADVIVIRVPTGGGKTALAATIAQWQQRQGAVILAPNKMLVEQFRSAFPTMASLRGKSDYWCTTWNCSVDKRPTVKRRKTCATELRCQGCTDYTRDLRRARSAGVLLCNYHVYLANKLHRQILVVDEAHLLIPFLKELAGKRFWQFQWRWPDSINTRDALRDWLNELPESAFYRKHRANDEESSWLEVPDANLQWLRNELNSPVPAYVIKFGTESYRGQSAECIEAVPVDISQAAQSDILWPSRGGKLVLLSATLSRKDIEQLGLSGKRVHYIDTQSPIPQDRRPIYSFPVCQVDCSFANQRRAVPHLIRQLGELMEHYSDSKGLVHATYSLAQQLRAASKQLSVEKQQRLVWHDAKNKASQYQHFRATDQPVVLVASGMYEGVDLPDDAGRWQVIAKVPWPSLADPAVAYLLEQDGELYRWEALKSVLQACGRICRTPEDWGHTHILDSTFVRLYGQCSADGLVPQWFQDAVVTW